MDTYIDGLKFTGRVYANYVKVLVKRKVRSMLGDFSIQQEGVVPSITNMDGNRKYGALYYTVRKEDSEGVFFGVFIAVVEIYSGFPPSLETITVFRVEQGQGISVLTPPKSATINVSGNLETIQLTLFGEGNITLTQKIGKIHEDWVE